MKQARRRVAALEGRVVQVRDAGCATCHRWPGIVIMDDAGEMTRPEECPDCGRLVPYVRVIHIVGVPLGPL